MVDHFTFLSTMYEGSSTSTFFANTYFIKTFCFIYYV